MPRRALLHALTAGDHSDKPNAFVLGRNGGRLCQPMCQSPCNVTLASNWNYRRKTRERFMSITSPFMAKFLQNSLSFCLPYGEMMPCNTNNYISALLISSDTFSWESKRQFWGVFSVFLASRCRCWMAACKIVSIIT